MTAPWPSPALDLRIQSAAPQSTAVTVEDLRTGRRETFASLQALARTWIDLGPPPDKQRCSSAPVPVPPPRTA